MNLVDVLAGKAREAEGRLGQLAAKNYENLEQKKALNRLEAAFEHMAADGELDEGEVDELMGKMRAAGLDPSEIDALFDELRGRDHSVRLDGDGEELSDLFREQLGEARTETSDDQADLNFAIQQQVGDYTHFLEAASRVSKSEHESAMTIIRNMKA